MSLENIVNVGLIGAGRIGKLHAENLTYRVPNAKLMAVADVHRPSAESCASRFSVPAVYDDPQLFFADSDIDAVVICSSTNTHALFIERAAAAGKHIFCEKPIDFDLGNIDRALDAVGQAGVKLQIGFNRRFDPNFKRIHEAVAAGEIGTPWLLRITSRDPAPPPLEYVKVSGGIFLDMTIHDFDMARYLIGSEVTEVFVAGDAMVDPEIGKMGDIDTAIITLRFENGVIGTIDNSRQASYGYDQRAEVFGSKGMITADNPLPHQTHLGDKSGFHQPPLFNFFLERYADSYVVEMLEFIDCVQQDKTPSVSGTDGRIPVLIGLAAKRSLKENRPVKTAEI